jgi:ribosomal protein S13
MFPSYLTEQALRGAVLSMNKDLSEDGHTANIKENALERVTQSLKGSGSSSSIAGQLNVQEMAIGLAVTAIAASFLAIKDQISNVTNQRVAFDKELEAGIATFTIPTQKEKRDLSDEERVVKNFIETSKKTSFFHYLGIRHGVLKDNKDSEFYSTLPFYLMSQKLGQPLSSSHSVDKQRNSISLFFQSALPKTIALIEKDFQNDIRFFEFWKSAVKKSNYLNNLRSPRFIIIALSNLLWNIQHPVDRNEGYPLGIEECIKLCREIELFLNDLLNDAGNTAVQEINSSSNHLLSFVRRIERQVKALRGAYTEEQLYDLNFNDITNSTYRTLRIMDKSVLKLIYAYKNPDTGKDIPDEMAATDLADSINDLNQLINTNPELMKPFVPLAESLNLNAKALPYLNNPPQTIIDILAIFIHSPTENKDILYEEIEKNTDTAKEFIKSLKDFYTRFVRPIKHVSNTELGITLFHKDDAEVAALTARRLIPILTLVIDDYKVDIGMHQSRTVKNDTDSTQKMWSAKEQIKGINELASEGIYYKWELSPFIKLAQDTEEELDKLPQHQYRFSKIAKLLDSINDIVQHYRNFLQLKSFQHFLINCLNKIKNEYTLLENHINAVDVKISKDQAITRNMTAILRPMMEYLNNSLNAFTAAARNFEHVITAPDFTEQQKRLMDAAFSSIKMQCVELFHDDPEFSALIESKPLEVNTASTNRTALIPKEPLLIIPSAMSTPPINDDEKTTDTPEPVFHEEITPEKNTTKAGQVTKSSIPKDINSNKVNVLKALVVRCRETLSYQSKYSQKGQLLNDLLTVINKTSNPTDSNIQHAVNELVRITLSYRSTWLFQAAYGETRSAKALISAIRDPQLNAILPLASLIFDSNDNLTLETDTQIIARFRNLREKNNWQKAVEDIKPAFIL